MKCGGYILQTSVQANPRQTTADVPDVSKARALFRPIGDICTRGEIFFDRSMVGRTEEKVLRGYLDICGEEHIGLFLILRLGFWGKNGIMIFCSYFNF